MSETYPNSTHARIESLPWVALIREVDRDDCSHMIRLRRSIFRDEVERHELENLGAEVTGTGCGPHNCVTVLVYL